MDVRDVFGVLGVRAKPLYEGLISAHARAIFPFLSLFSRGHYSIFPVLFSDFGVFSSYGMGVWTRFRRPRRHKYH